MKNKKMMIPIALACLTALALTFQNCAGEYNPEDYTDQTSTGDGDAPPPVTPPQQPVPQPPTPPAPPVTPPPGPGPVTPPPPPAPVVVAPAIVTKSADSTVGILTRVTLGITATGENVTYQWYKAGVMIPGATSAMFVIEATQVADTGQYGAVASNAGGNSSVFIQLTVIQMPNQIPPVVSKLPENKRVCNDSPFYCPYNPRGDRGVALPAGVSQRGAEVSFSVTATGATMYQWSFAPLGSTVYTDILGANAATYKFRTGTDTASVNLQLGTYKVVVSNVYGTREGSATLTSYSGRP